MMKTVFDAVNKYMGRVVFGANYVAISSKENTHYGYGEIDMVVFEPGGKAWLELCTVAEFNQCVQDMKDWQPPIPTETPEEKEALDRIESSKSTGMKHDQDKPMYNLLPANAIESLAKVLTFGAKKYTPNSWQDVEDGLERYRAALLRHAFAIQRGELLDEESGLPHSAHIMCCAAFINELEGK